MDRRGTVWGKKKDDENCVVTKIETNRIDESIENNTNYTEYELKARPEHLFDDVYSCTGTNSTEKKNS